MSSVQFDLVVSALSEFANTAMLIDQNLNEIAVRARCARLRIARPLGLYCSSSRRLRAEHLAGVGCGVAVGLTQTLGCVHREPLAPPSRREHTRAVPPLEPWARQ